MFEGRVPCVRTKREPSRQVFSWRLNGCLAAAQVVRHYFPDTAKCFSGAASAQAP